MKSLVFFVACVLMSASALKQELMDELMAKIQEFGVSCAETEKATPEDMEALMQKKPPVTHAGKCVIFCVAQKLNLMHPDGTFDEGYVEWLDKAKADDPEFHSKLTKLYSDCEAKSVPKEDLCEVAFDLVSCSVHEANKVGLGTLF